MATDREHCITTTRFTTLRKWASRCRGQPPPYPSNAFLGTSATFSARGLAKFVELFAGSVPKALLHIPSCKTQSERSELCTSSAETEGHVRVMFQNVSGPNVRRQTPAAARPTGGYGVSPTPRDSFASPDKRIWTKNFRQINPFEHRLLLR